jgi:heme exporter protein B
MDSFLIFLHHELRLRLRGAAGAAAFGLFLLAGSMAPLALGADEEMLRNIMPGLVWIFAALSALLGLEGLFQEDMSEGRFTVMMLSSQPLWLTQLGTMLVYWLVACVPLIIAAVPVAFLLGTEPETLTLLLLSLLVGTPALAFLGTALSALCAGLQRGTGLIIFLALPFFAPALIFGTRAAAGGDDMMAAFFFLGAFSLQAIAVCPLLAAAAIRQHMS